MTLYLIRAGCPRCGEIVQLVEETPEALGVMQDVPINTRWCPECGDQVRMGEWDRNEETEIERVPPTDPSAVEDRAVLDDDMGELLGEVDGTIDVLRGEAEELRVRDDGDDVEDVAEQLEHRADVLAEVLTDVEEDDGETWHAQAADYHGARFVFEEETGPLTAQSGGESDEGGGLTLSQDDVWELVELVRDIGSEDDVRRLEQVLRDAGHDVEDGDRS